MSPGSNVMMLRRASAYFSRISPSSSLITPSSLAGLSRIDCRSWIIALQLGELVAQLLAVELREPPQLHVEDVLSLDLAEVERRHHEALTGDVDVFGRRG